MGKREKLEQKKKKEQEEIEAQYDGKKLGAADFLAKHTAMREVENRFELEVQHIEEAQSRELNMELDRYRERLQKIRDAMSGKAGPPTPPTPDSLSMKEYEEAMAPWKEAEQKLRRQRNDKINSLNLDLP